MSRLPLMTALAAILLSGASEVAMAETAADADAKYKYPPYSQQAQPSQQSQPEANYSTAHASGDPPPPAAYDQNPPADGARSDEPIYRDDARRGADTRGDDFDARDDEPPPPRDAAVPSPRVGDRPLVTATASAPDPRIPYDVRAHDARRAAIEAWRSKAAERFGPGFSQWRMAAHRHVDCRPERRDDVVCTVSGEPVQGYGRFGRRDRYDPY